MTTNLGRMSALTTLVQQQDAGGYTLPADLTAAYDLTLTVAEVPAAAREAFAVRDAADTLLHTLGQGRKPNLADLAERVRRAHQSGTDQELAERIRSDAAEQAQAQAVNFAADLADKVIVEHLRPVFVDTLEQAARHADTLSGHALNPRSLVSAPAKVRGAWTALADVATRYKLLREARYKVNTAGLRTPQHDPTGQYASFSDPLALFPGQSATARVPQIPWPKEPVDLMLWLVGEAAKAKPWLPTVAEQDAAWWAQYGEAQELRRASYIVAAAQAGASV